MTRTKPKLLCSFQARKDGPWYEWPTNIAKPIQKKLILKSSKEKEYTMINGIRVFALSFTTSKGTKNWNSTTGWSVLT